MTYMLRPETIFPQFYRHRNQTCHHLHHTHTTFALQASCPPSTTPPCDQPTTARGLEDHTPCGPLSPHIPASLHALKAFYSGWCQTTAHPHHQLLTTCLPACLFSLAHCLPQELQTSTGLAKPVNTSAIQWAELRFHQQGLNLFQVCPSLVIFCQP